MTTTIEKHRMSILGEEGDVRVEWDPDKKDEMKQAERTFEEMTKKGYHAFEMCEDGNKGEQMDKFDKQAKRILLVPPMAGG